jgi:DUF917 family protein
MLGCSTNMDVHVIDGDWMGRAYPTATQITPCVYEVGPQLLPTAIADGNGTTLIRIPLFDFHIFLTLKLGQLMAAAKDETMVERVFRAALAELGSAVAVAFGPYSGLQTRQYAVQHTLSLAWRIGRAVASCRAKRDFNHVAEAIVNAAGGNRAARVLGKGKVVGVERRLLKGHAYGEVIIEEKPGKKMKIPYKNENIVATIETNGDDEVGWEFLGCFFS